MWRLVLRSSWRRRRRLVGTGLAIVLGVAFLAGTLTLGDTLRAGFGDVFAAVNAGVDAVVRGEETVGSDLAAQPPVIDAAVAERASRLAGVATAAPEAEGRAQLLGADGEAIGGNGPPTLGRSWIPHAALRGYDIVEGRAPRAAGEVAIDVDAADAGRLGVGDTTIVRTPAAVEVHIVGLLELSGGAAGGTTLTVFTLEEAQHLLLGRPGVATRILATAEPGVTQEELADRLAAIAPPGTETLTGEELTAETLDALRSDFLDVFEAFLLAFAGVALLVTTFSIHNTLSITVAQRTRESALQRALGASRGQVVAGTMLEAVVTGAVASVLGLGVGVGLAAGLRPLLAGIGLALDSARLVIAPSTVILCVGVGVGVSLVAAMLPALRASRVPPLAAMRDLATDVSGVAVWRLGVGTVLVLAGVGAALAAIAAPDAAYVLAGAAALLSSVGTVVVGPVLAGPVGAVVGGVARRVQGITGVLAHGNARRNPRRTAATASALMVGVGIVVLFTVVAASMKATTQDAVNRSFGGDLAVLATGFSGSGISPAMVDDLEELPEVGAVAGLGLGAAMIDGEETVFTVAEPAALTRVVHVDVVSGRMEHLTGIAVSRDSADERGWEVGSKATMAFPDGRSETVPVEVLFEGGAGDALGNVVVPASLWATHAVQPTLVRVLVQLAEDVHPGAGRAAVQAVAEAHGSPEVFDRDSYVEEAAGDVDQFLAMVYGLLALAIVIALMGIANTLSLSIHERTREIGVLRAVGQTRRQLRAMIRWESVIIALLGTGTGLALGTFLGWTFVRAIAATEGLGVFAVPPAQLLLILILGAVVGVFAAIRPARRAARLNVLSAIASE